MRFQGPLILGAGPAGCAAAITLARAGQPVLLLDRDETVGDPLCGGFMSWRTAAQLHDLGIDLAALGAHEVSHLRLFAGNRSASANLPAPAFGLSRHALDSAMRRRAVTLGAAFEVDTIRRIEGLAAMGSANEWQGDALFLASGKHDLRGAVRPRESADPALGLRLRLPATASLAELLSGSIELHLFTGGYAGIVLQEDGSANICLAVRKSLLTRAGGDRRRLLEHLASDHPAFGQRLADGWRAAQIDSIGSVPYGWIASASEPGLFRLGDQAAVIPSLAGEGMSIALASGIEAARFWQEGGASAAPEYQSHLARQAVSPIRAARLARQLAESRAGHVAAMTIMRHLPGLIGLLMDRTRIHSHAALAREASSA